MLPSLLWWVAAAAALINVRKIGVVVVFWALSILFANWIVLAFGITPSLPASLILVLSLWLQPRDPARRLVGGVWFWTFGALMLVALVRAQLIGTGFGLSWIVLVLVIPVLIAEGARRADFDEATLAALRRGLVFAFAVEAVLLLAQSATGGLGLMQGIGLTEDAIPREDPRGYLAILFPGVFDPMVVRARGSLATGNYAGQFMDFCPPLALAAALAAPVLRERWRWLAVLGVLLWGILLTYSRGSLMGFGVAALIIVNGMGTTRRGPRRFFTWVTVVAMAVVMIRTGKAILASFENATDVASLTEREGVWLATIPLIVQSPGSLLFGLGPKAYQDVTTVSDVEAVTGRQEVFGHNGLLVQAVEYGTPSTVLLVLLLLAWGRCLWSAVRRTKGHIRRGMLLGVLGSVAAAWTHQMVDHAWGDHNYKAFVFLLLGLGWAVAAEPAPEMAGAVAQPSVAAAPGAGER